MNKTKQISMGIAIGFMMGMKVLGVTVETNSLSYPASAYTAIVNPELWIRNGGPCDWRVVDGGTIEKARGVAESSTGEVHTIGWGGYSSSSGF